MTQSSVRTGLDLFTRAVGLAPNEPALYYFDQTLTYRDLDLRSNGLAAALVAGGFRSGDRLAAYLQNTPQFVIALLATWKAGGIFVPINPMNRSAELSHILRDAEPRALILEPELYEASYAKVDADAPRPSIILTAAPAEELDRRDARLFAVDAPSGFAGVTSLQSAIFAHAGAHTDVPASPDDIAMLVYTSGTTGKPKGAVISHHGVAHSATIGQANMRHPNGATMLVIAPLFHITGLAMNLFTTVHALGSMVLTYRFHPGVIVDAIVRHRPHTTVGAITAFIALSNTPAATREVLSCFKMIGCGGAPMAPAAFKAFQQQYGLTLYNGYGMTETSGVAVMVPDGDEQRVDPDSGALSVGRAVEGCTLTVIGDDDKPLPSGEAGEVIIGSQTVSPGYWRRDEETALSRHPLGLRTGDIGKLDDDGWLYLVDRKKDMIIAAGYKVWPREVEDVLYAHPAVREVAVIGVPDEYRGETVKAVVSLKPGHHAEPDELIIFCRDRLSAYKYPRVIDIIDELPKTVTGKILRRALRDVAA